MGLLPDSLTRCRSCFITMNFSQKQLKCNVNSFACCYLFQGPPGRSGAPGRRGSEVSDVACHWSKADLIKKLHDCSKIRTRKTGKSSFVPPSAWWKKKICCNGNRTEWSPIRDNKIGRPLSGSPICWSRAWLGTELDDTNSSYQLIIRITLSEKRGRAKLWEKGKICIKKLTKRRK